MRFAPAAEQREFATSLRELLAAADVPAASRAWAAGDQAPLRKVWGRLGEAGALALALTEQHGGFGATAVDLVLAFEEVGRAAVPGPLIESAAVLPALLVGTEHAGRLPSIGTGELIATIAMPPTVPYAVDARYADATYVLEGTDLSEAVLTGDLSSVDRSRHLATVEAGLTIDTHADADTGYERGALACAAQLVGLGTALLERATTYAGQRVQFGRPIGEFQAVKHQLADVLVSLELARPLVFAAALALDDGDTGAGPGRTLERDVSAAKVASGDAAYRAARTALQVHGAIGYTAEYDLSLWLTKVRALVTAWGTPQWHRTRVLAAFGATASEVAE
ncbi:MAG TPA: acyl-CoA dehydrogenase family protein [Jatrophihabitantaceae bacterium]|jgi:hypothetical protein